MAKLTLNIIGDISNVEQGIRTIKSSLKSIESERVKISVDTTGLDKVDKSVTSYLNAQARVINANARVLEARAKLKAATDSLQISENKLAEAETKLATQEERTNTVSEQRRLTAEKTAATLDIQAAKTQNTTAATEQMSTKTEELSDRTSILGNSLTTVAAKMAVWQIMGALISAPIRAMREAIETLKAVDSALVTVQKTTGFSEEQLDDLTGKTYELAAAYGRTADELLNMSATFARAGFTDQLVQMTELAALLQNVGDLEEDTAAKFLLAANAAWQLNGDYASLMEIIDGMNMVTNQAAVDMEALTTGITVAGSVFANAGETAQTYTALVGTAVAATQRSGAEIARGLRTIAMNVRAIKGELDDGEIIDEDTISDAAAALASVGISVADARGELRLTSDVLADLAEKWDDLTTGEQSYIAQSLAGKRQANVLTALMQNWGEVERQMALYADGAGSALQENEIYLDSWEAKSNQLNATWTKFISNLIETDAVKASLDVVTGAIEFLDSGIGKAVIAGAAAVALLANATKIINGVTTAVKALGTAVSSNPYLLVAGLAIAAVTMIGGAIEESYATRVADAEAARDEAKSLVEAADAASQEANELDRLIARYDELSGIRVRTQEEEAEYQDILKEINELLGDRTSALEGLTAGTNAYADALRTVTTEEREQARMDAAKARYRAEEALLGVGPQDIFGNPTRTVDEQLSDYEGLIKQKEELDRRAQEDNSIYDSLLYKTVEDAIAAAKPYVEAVIAAREAEEKWQNTLFSGTEGKIAAAESTYRLSESAEDAADSMDDAAVAAQELSEKISGLKTADYAKDAISALTSATKEFEEYGGLTSSTLEKLETLFPGITDALYDVNGNLTETAQQALTTAGGLAAVAAEFINVADEGRNLSLADARRELEALQNMAYQTSGSLALIAELQGRIANGEATANEITVHIDAAGASTTGGSSGGGTKTDTRKTGYEEKLKLLQSQLTLMQAQGASVEEQAAKMREIQDALHEEAEYLRTTKEYLDGDASAIAEVNGLSSEWWSWNEKILKALEEQEEQLLANAEAIRDEYIASLETELDRLKEAHDTKEDQLKLEEKILAVQQAQADLANAQAERTVRYYNALTGQWEWAADAQKVKSAQEALEKAQNDLSDYRSEQAYNAKVSALKQQQSDASSVYDMLAGMTDAERIAFMQANSAAWATSDNQDLLHTYNAMAGAMMGAEYDPATGRWYKDGVPLYDRGGVLRGVGGIKATRQDEIILPPDVTQAMLNPVADSVLLSRMDELRYLYGAGTVKAGTAAGGGIGKQINGNVYELGGVTLTEQQARATTVYELAQLARTLKTRNSVN